MKFSLEIIHDWKLYCKWWREDMSWEDFWRLLESIVTPGKSCGAVHGVSKYNNTMNIIRRTKLYLDNCEQPHGFRLAMDSYQSKIMDMIRGLRLDDTQGEDLITVEQRHKLFEHVINKFTDKEGFEKELPWISVLESIKTELTLIISMMKSGKLAWPRDMTEAFTKICRVINSAVTDREKDQLK